MLKVVKQVIKQLHYAEGVGQPANYASSSMKSLGKEFDMHYKL